MHYKPLLPAVAARRRLLLLCLRCVPWRDVLWLHRRVWFPRHLNHAVAVRSRLLLLRLRPVPRRDILWLHRRVWMCALVFVASLAVRGLVTRRVLL